LFDPFRVGNHLFAFDPWAVPTAIKFNRFAVETQKTTARNRLVASSDESLSCRKT
jgi:hypothetical protein